MDPALRAQNNAAAQQQVREVAAVLKMQHIVYDSFRDTGGLLRYAQRAAMNRMSSTSIPQPPLQQAVVLQHGPDEQHAPSRREKRIKPVFLRALVL